MMERLGLSIRSLLFIIALFTRTQAAPFDPDSILPMLHKPWIQHEKDDTYLQNYDRKGQRCKDGICKPVKGGCDDCQYAVPLNFDLD